MLTKVSYDVIDIPGVSTAILADTTVGTVGAAMAGKANLASPTFTGTVGGITKAMVGLGSVDNTSDLAKPVSTATTTALALKANLANPTFTGTVSVTGTVGISNGLNVTGVVNVTGTVVASGDITAFSDERLKSDVKVIEGALDKVLQLRGVTFTKDGTVGLGVIAQEVQKVIPEVVHVGDEYLSVAYGNIVGVLIEAIKELKAEINELKSK